jgi:hypothetical protein
MPIVSATPEPLGRWTDICASGCALCMCCRFDVSQPKQHVISATVVNEHRMNLGVRFIDETCDLSVESMLKPMHGSNEPRRILDYHNGGEIIGLIGIIPPMSASSANCNHETAELLSWQRRFVTVGLFAPRL